MQTAPSKIVEVIYVLPIDNYMVIIFKLALPLSNLSSKLKCPKRFPGYRIPHRPGPLFIPSPSNHMIITYLPPVDSDSYNKPLTHRRHPWRGVWLRSPRIWSGPTATARPSCAPVSPAGLLPPPTASGGMTGAHLCLFTSVYPFSPFGSQTVALFQPKKVKSPNSFRGLKKDRSSLG